VNHRAERALPAPRSDDLRKRARLDESLFQSLLLASAGCDRRMPWPASYLIDKGAAPDQNPVECAPSFLKFLFLAACDFRSTPTAS